MYATNTMSTVAQQPFMLWYSDRLPSTAYPPKKITVAEFMQIYQSCHAEPLVYAATTRFQQCDDVQQQKYQPIFPQLLNAWRNPAIWSDKLTIGYVDPSVNFAVFANEDFPPFRLLGVDSGVDDNSPVE